MADAKAVKELRDLTGAGFVDCRKALDESGGDMEKAVEYLRKKGMATAEKKAGREASEGLVQSYAHHNGRLGVMVEVNCETDFVARNDTFKKFAKDLALHIANTSPRYLSREDVPAEVVSKEREIARQKAINEGKKEAILEKITDGVLEKYYGEYVLLEQPWMFDDKKTVREIVTGLIAEIKENIVIRRFVRYGLGESTAAPVEEQAEAQA